MKKLILLSTITVLFFSNCKKEQPITYLYPDQPQTLNCNNIDTKLFSDAYYAFEKAITTQSQNVNKRPNYTVPAASALRNFIGRSKGTLRIDNYITKETLEVFNNLKNQDIWKNNQLKNNAAIADCIGNHIANTGIKTTFNALRQTEDLDAKLMAAAIADLGLFDQYKDKALMTYAALDLYYAKFFELDLTKITLLEANTPANQKETVTNNKTVELKDEHAGHNHGPNDGHNH